MSEKWGDYFALWKTGRAVCWIVNYSAAMHCPILSQIVGREILKIHLRSNPR